MGYSKVRPVSYPEYGIAVDMSGPVQLQYDEPYNITDFVLDTVLDVDIDQDDGDSFLDILGLREDWDDLLSNR